MAEPNERSPVVIHVCATCRAEGEPLEPRAERAGARLIAALRARRGDGDPEIAATECFSVCRRPCSLSFAKPGGWTYLCGDVAADADPQEIFDAARLYAAAPEGIIPWKQRPPLLKSGVVARLPPSLSPKEP